MDKQKVVYPYSRILFSLKRNEETDSYYNMGEFRKHYAMWKTPDAEGLVLYGSIYTECSA